MTDFANWLITLIAQIFQAAWDFLGDVVIWCFEFILRGVVDVISLILLPCFMSITAAGSALQVPLNSLASASPLLMYFVSFVHLDRCFAMLSCAIIFVFSRKAATLFQW